MELRTLVFALALALVAVGTAAVVPEEASAWTGCHPHWDGETYDETTLPDGTVVKTPHFETLCY